MDANLNRVNEGLRVCEDILRFLYDDRMLTARLKKLRHQLTNRILEFPKPYRALVAARDVACDVGKKSAVSVKRKPEWKDIFLANMKRSEEGLRVFEEVSKKLAPRQSRHFQSLRFELYDLEQRALKKF